MTAADELSVEKRDGVLHVTIRREAKRNALSRRLLAQIRAVFAEWAADEDLRFAILTGAGEKSFAAGGDLKDLMSVQGEQAAAEMAVDAKAALSAIRTFPVPVVAAVNGDALGGGAELAVACDMRVVASHARIGFIQGRLAISTAWGGGVDLARLVGPSRALQLMTRGQMIGAAEALSIGLANCAAREGESLEHALDAFVAPMRRQAPQVMRAFKAVTGAERQRDRQEADDLETRLFSLAWAHPDHDAAVEGILQPRE